MEPDETKLKEAEIEARKNREAKKRADLLAKIHFLRVHYKRTDFEDPTELSNEALESIVNKYTSIAKVESKVNYNYYYLIIFWLIIEYVCTVTFNLPFRGFVINQFHNMSVYNTYMTQIAEEEVKYEDQAEEVPDPSKSLIEITMKRAICYAIENKLEASLGKEASEVIRKKIESYLTPTPDRDSASFIERLNKVDSDNPAPAEPQIDVDDSNNDFMKLLMTYGPTVLGTMFSSQKKEKKRPKRRL